MSKFHFILITTVILSASASYANIQDMSSDSNSCKMIAKACKKAGFDHSKKFWKDCMKPVILGQTVDNVKIDADTVKSCRSDKIKKLQQELDELKNVN